MRKLYFVLLLFDATILFAAAELLELPDKTIEFELVAAPQAQVDNVTLWEEIRSKCDTLAPHFHLPKPTSRLEAQMLIDRVQQRYDQLDADFVLPVDVIGRVDDQFHFDAFDPVTSLPLGWGDWSLDTTEFQFRFAYERQAKFNLLKSADLGYKTATSADIGTMSYVMCVREYRDEIFPQTEHVLKSHVAATKMSFADGKEYCKSLRSNCPFSSCSTRWRLVVPYKADEETYFVRLANKLWTGLTANYEHYDSLDVTNDTDYELNVYGTANVINENEIVWYKTSGTLPVVCADYKYGWQYDALQIDETQSKELHETTSGNVVMLISMGMKPAKDSESVCANIHADAKVMDVVTKQDYYDYISKVDIPDTHLLQNGDDPQKPYIDEIGTFPIIESTDDFTTAPTFAKFVNGTDSVDLNCFLTLHENWKSLELCQSSFKYSLFNFDRQLSIGDATRVCNQMDGEQATPVNSSDLDAFVGLRGSFMQTVDIDGVAMILMYIGKWQGDQALEKCRDFGATLPRPVSSQQNAAFGIAFRALNLDNVILNGTYNKGRGFQSH